LQQTPSTQKPLAHGSAVMQGAPSGEGLTQAWATQIAPTAQSALVLQEVRQAVAPHR
jgi:hypothetical protein